MKAKIFLMVVLMTTLISACSVSNNQPMTESICKTNGGEWEVMEILKEEGHEWREGCRCSDGQTYISKGDINNCP